MEDAMRRYALIALLPLAACSQSAKSNEAAAGSSSKPEAAASGTGSTRTFAIDGFNAVDAAGPDDVDVRVGAGFSVRAEGDPTLLDKLEISRDGDSLRVTRKSTSGFSWGSNRQHVKIYVTMPRITAASATGSGDLSVDHVEGDAFAANATGSGDLSIGMLSVQKASLSLTGSGDLKTGGTAESGNLSITGSGDIDAANLRLKGATVSVLGSGGVKAQVSGPATVNVMGSGDVTLTGGAKCTTSKAGSGDVSCS
jgi:hypothetical protein